MALFTTVEDLSKYIPSIVNVDDFTLFEGELAKAERYLQLDLLGNVYAEIANDVQLQALSEAVVAYMAAVRFIPQIDLSLTGNGFVVTSNSNQSPASKERVERLISTYRENVIDAIEDLHLYLEGKDNYYEAWQTAKIYTRYDDMPLATNSQFTQYAIGWDNHTSIDFYGLRTMMIVVRERFILPKFGQSFYDYLLAHPSEEKILPIIHNFRQAYAAAVLEKQKAAENIMATVWGYVIENRAEYPEFDSWYQASEKWENSEDNNIVAFGV